MVYDKVNIITDFIENHTEFVSNVAIIGIYYFKKGEILRDEIQYLLENDIREKGEYQLTNALENMKQKGLKFVPGEVSAWMDCGNKEITVETNSRVLQYAKTEGENLVSKDVVLENSKIVEPCYIGKNVVLKDTVIGPNVSLGEGSKVYDSAISNSLIQSNVVIKNASLDHAMIGHHVHFDGNFTSVSIGDYSILN